MKDTEASMHFFRFLKTYDISEWNAEELPMTTYRKELQSHSLDLPVKFLLETLCDTPRRWTLTSDLYQKYKNWCLENGYSKITHISQFTYVIKCRLGVNTGVRKVHDMFHTKRRSSCFDFRYLNQAIKRKGLDSFCTDLTMPVIEEYDPITEFVKDNIDDLKKGWTLSSIVYKMFSDYCIDEGVEEVPSQKSFTTILVNDFSVLKDRKTAVDENGTRKQGRCLNFDNVSFDDECLL